MKKATLIIAATLVIALICGSAFAANGIKLTNTAQKETIVTKEDGTKEVVLEQPEKVLPGDTIVYTIFYENQGEEVAEKVAINNPIPESTMYLDGSAAGVGAVIQFSVDNGATFDFPGNLKVKTPEGAERMAGPGDYTGIRWTLGSDLPPGGKGSVSFKVKIK
ncbi:conserved repeat domain-containing protein [Desulfatibacillum alkenivorans DSM 16219]|jgi:uncharacterized repeat protein (TIGR01451 family)|uniref:Conserved repeat domain-containing protein n=1 Tax=Desulfatibacillum alkenivorans DSM 16219 TaxID=1121393 RepID=A0A1M6LTI7_9BACT|nr:DUF11 domain-containing protein [Desulfatibacillum alkenivorans]SHJ74382.1 conserved repeat domain-containing protein [Desulfatibacillum alkenivorans DSM 16219]